MVVHVLPTASYSIRRNCSRDDSLMTTALGSPPIRFRWPTTDCPRHNVLTVSMATKQRCVLVATFGSSAIAIVTGSGRSKPCKCVVVSANCSTVVWISTQKRASGVPTASSAEASAGLNKMEIDGNNHMKVHTIIIVDDRRSGLRFMVLPAGHTYISSMVCSSRAFIHLPEGQIPYPNERVTVFFAAVVCT